MILLYRYGEDIEACGVISHKLYYTSRQQNIGYKIWSNHNSYGHRLHGFLKLYKLKWTQTVGCFPKPQINRFTKEFIRRISSLTC